MKNISLILVVTVFIAISLVGCFPRERQQVDESPSGFFMGIWHGWIAPISLIVGLFNSDVRIYDPHNIGWWYDFGYYIAVIAGFGGIVLSRRKKESHS